MSDKSSLKDDCRCVYSYWDKRHSTSLPQLATFAVGEDVKAAMARVIEFSDLKTLSLLSRCELRPLCFWNIRKNSHVKPSSDMRVVDLGPIVAHFKSVSED